MDKHYYLVFLVAFTIILPFSQQTLSNYEKFGMGLACINSSAYLPVYMIQLAVLGLFLGLQGIGVLAAETMVIGVSAIQTIYA